MTPRGGAFDRDMDRSPEAKQAFAAFLREAREKLGLTMAEMARLLGSDLKLNGYWNYEAERTLPRTQADKERIARMVEAMLAEQVAPQETEVAPQETVTKTTDIVTEQAKNVTEQANNVTAPEPVEISPQAAQDETPEPEPQEETPQFIPYTPPKNLKEVLDHGQPSLDGDDDRTPMEQLRDLDVEVVTVPSLGLRPNEEKPHKPKGVTNIRWYNPSRPANYLLDVISITQNNITVGHKVAEMLGGDGVFLKIGCADRNGAVVPTFCVMREKEKNTLVLRRNTAKNSYRISSSSNIKWLMSEGLKPGRYRIKPLRNVENTFVGVPEGE